ncbi:MAG: hypothetical protein K0Q59_3892 [Paenibacillus sp.]|jgi:hypothetical protein|nr:hypothetical protein [Paenibacillus sp.]
MSTLLFLDDWMLSRRTNLVRRLGKPRWVPEGTLDENMSSDGAWNRPTVFRVPETGKWRAIYSGVTYENDERIPLGMMVADSDDGIHWVKPDVSQLVPLPGRRLPNQVHHAISGGPAYYDEHDPDPMRRLKFLYTVSKEKKQYYLSSPDGIIWKHEGIWGERVLDAPISIFYNSIRESYVISNRPLGGDRRVAFIETKDFETFSKLQLILTPDPEDSPLMEFYGMTVFPYEDMYIGLLLLMHTEPSQLNKAWGYFEGGLTYSFDGWTFNRAYHKAFMERNDRSEQGGGTVAPSCILVDDSNQIRIYSGASRATHFQKIGPVDAALIMHVLRLDGFMYLEPEALKGSLTTKRLRIEGDRLQLNVRAPYGHVRVQILDGHGVPFEGFRFDDCVPFTGDALFHTPIWADGRSLGNLAGNVGYIEVEVVNGEIYAIRGDFTLNRLEIPREEFELIR